MEIEIESRKDNKLLQREEVLFTLRYEGKTPGRHKVRKQLKDLLGKNVIILEYLKPVYGASEARGYARAYSSEKRAREVEPRHIVKRNLSGGPEPQEEPAQEPAPAETEKPAEEAPEGGQ
ncbi:MAG: 30S ribosomal protein S24e [Thermoplasmatota archaeon]